jgi:hypothetical protein
MNIDVVSYGALTRATDYLHELSVVFRDEPMLMTSSPGYNAEMIAERRGYWSSVITHETIREWLFARVREGLEMEVADVREFESYDELFDHIGGDPLEVGVPVDSVVASEYTDREPRPVSPARLRFIAHLARIYFSAALAAADDGEGDVPLFELLGRAGVIDRWGVGHMVAGPKLEPMLLMRIRGRWLLWPVITGRAEPLLTV